MNLSNKKLFWLIFLSFIAIAPYIIFILNTVLEGHESLSVNQSALANFGSFVGGCLTPVWVILNTILIVFISNKQDNLQKSLTENQLRFNILNVVFEEFEDYSKINDCQNEIEIRRVAHRLNGVWLKYKVLFDILFPDLIEQKLELKSKCEYYEKKLLDIQHYVKDSIEYNILAQELINLNYRIDLSVKEFLEDISKYCLKF